MTSATSIKSSVPSKPSLRRGEGLALAGGGDRRNLSRYGHSNGLPAGGVQRRVCRDDQQGEATGRLWCNEVIEQRTVYSWHTQHRWEELQRLVGNIAIVTENHRQSRLFACFFPIVFVVLPAPNCVCRGRRGESLLERKIKCAGGFLSASFGRWSCCNKHEPQIDINALILSVPRFGGKTI